MREREERVLVLADSELRVMEAKDDDGAKIAGYAARFDVRSLDLGFGQEIVRAGAFTKTLREADPVALWGHDPKLILGRVSAGTLSVREEERGLAFVTDVPTEAPGPYWAEQVRIKNVTGASFGFRTIKDKWSQDENGVTLRELLEVELLDVSPTPFPAYPQTDVYLRSLGTAEGVDLEVLSEALRNEALTKPEIRALVETMMGDRLPEPGRVAHSKAAGFLDRERRRLDLVELEL
jgi:HK97 family phage prohead protease